MYNYPVKDVFNASWQENSKLRYQKKRGERHRYRCTCISKAVVKCCCYVISGLSQFSTVFVLGDSATPNSSSFDIYGSSFVDKWFCTHFKDLFILNKL